ncbi:MAG: hypothetical protein AB7F96_10165 [Beijerinckiaceae bacterium]
MCEVHNVHLIGSVALPDTASVFEAVAGELGPWLKRIPDGETGARGRWIFWQRQMLLEHPDFELASDLPDMELTEWNGRVFRKVPYIRLKPGTDIAAVKIETGYAEAAIDSYATFAKMRDAGTIPAGVKFQVCLPTAIASAYQFIAPASIPDFLKIYEGSLLGDLKRIVDAIPHQDLSIQWDVCQEVLLYENYPPYAHRPADFKDKIAAELIRIGEAVPADVDMGYHLCYGSPADAHLVMPKDMAVMVELTQSFLPKVKRSVNFLHMPVPQDRSDDTYFAPLKNLNLPPETELYLGLIHHGDAPGDTARLKAACKVAGKFGVATECGWGRTDPARVPGLIRAHREIMEAQTS